MNPDKTQMIKSHYPDAIEGTVYTDHCMDLLVSGNQFDTERTLLATSVCSDEIIRSATNFRDKLSIEHPFQLGGLAGYPFTGLTGLGAFLSHIPEGGGAIIIYGPHIGISAEGRAGLMKRAGQTHNSSCCGALKATLGNLQESTTPTADKDLDYQLWRIEESLQKHRETILQNEEPLIEATEEMYRVIDHDLNQLIQSSREILKGYRVALVGGIIINTDHLLPDWFAPRRFDVFHPDGVQTSLSLSPKSV
jgi:hypothetical protein